MSEGEGTDLTEWDSSKATLYRIDGLLKACSQSSYSGDLEGWYKCLEALKREAYVKMKRAHHKPKCSLNLTDKTYCYRCHCEKLFNELRNNIDAYTRNGKQKGADRILFRQLDTAEIFLRDFMDARGMLLRDKRDVLTAFKEG